jgi:flagellar biosynthesis protein FlhA
MRQLFARPRRCVSGGFLGVLVFTSLPAIPLLMIGGGCVGLAVMMRRKEGRQGQAGAVEAELQGRSRRSRRGADRGLPPVDPMEMEIGVGLIPLADPSRGGDLLPRITGVRQQRGERDRHRAAQGPHPRQPAAGREPLPHQDRQQPGGRGGVVRPAMMLAMSSGMSQQPLAGLSTKDPVFSSRRIGSKRECASRRSCTATRRSSRPPCSPRTSRRSFAGTPTSCLPATPQHLLDELKKTSPAVVERVDPRLDEAERGAAGIADAVARGSADPQPFGDPGDARRLRPKIKDPVWLTEYVRHRLARTICSRFSDADNRLYVVTLDPAMEDRIASGIDKERGLLVRMSPKAIETTCERIGEQVSKLTQAGRRAIVLVSPQIRAGVKQLTSASLPRLVVLSYNEIARDTTIESVGVVTDG